MLQNVIQIAEFFESNLVFVAWLADLTTKSLLLVFIFKYLEERETLSLSSNYKYKLWLMLIVIIGLLPFSFGFTGPLFRELLPDSNLSLITILVPTSVTPSTELAASDSSYWLVLALSLYFGVLAFHLTKLSVSFLRLRWLRSTTKYQQQGALVDLLEKLRLDIGIHTKVSIGVNGHVNSPMTFGYTNPTIILPVVSCGWNKSLCENVLLHELSHIKRHDWLTFIGVYLIAAINWFNPFVWHCVNRLSLEAEFSCDNMVLKSGKSPKIFANQILSIARAGLEKNTGELLVRSITDNSDLTLRIENILNHHRSNNSGKLPIALVLLGVLVLMFTISNAGTVFAVGDEKDYPSEKLRLIYSESPAYPDAAFKNGVQGLVQYSFEVDEFGSIAPESIRLEQSEPGKLFEESSLQALKSFKFKPRKVRGKTIATPNVSYTFNFTLGF